jgi:hypothetical protein
MLKRLSISLLACLLFAGFSGTAFATSYDYGDATGYTQAKHSTADWQRLGRSWDAESSQKAIDTSDDGVSWSIDNGLTWGHKDLTAGQTVKFKFDMYKKEWGRHIEDHLKVWIDWNQDKDFTDAGETIYQAAWDFKKENGYQYGDGFAGISKSFFTSITIPDYAKLGDTWLRARVVCSADNPDLNKMTSTDYYWQGEVEDWKLTVNPVPEPSTMLLVGLGLGSLAVFRRKSQK